MASVMMAIASGSPGVGVKVVEETEERSEGWVSAHKCAREERHIACDRRFDDSFSCSESWFDDSFSCSER